MTLIADALSKIDQMEQDLRMRDQAIKELEAKNRQLMNHNAHLELELSKAKDEIAKLRDWDRCDDCDDDCDCDDSCGKRDCACCDLDGQALERCQPKSREPLIDPTESKVTIVVQDAYVEIWLDGQKLRRFNGVTNTKFKAEIDTVLQEFRLDCTVTPRYK